MYNAEYSLSVNNYFPNAFLTFTYLVIVLVSLEPVFVGKTKNIEFGVYLAIYILLGAPDIGFMCIQQFTSSEAELLINFNFILHPDTLYF